MMWSGKRGRVHVAVTWADLFEISRRTTWPFHIHNPVRTITGKEDIPSRRGIAWKFFKRTIDIAEYRNAEDDVNPAENRTFGDFFHDEFALHFIGDTALIAPAVELPRLKPKPGLNGPPGPCKT